ncbi:unnamed protein product [Cladocopium goreaui]|uniref:Myosin-2 heavy chain n=1 Tax=Cladocopium goreaui TaxID=2562237 RepID=A0A9P1CA77_9DINO|nr:unnamed protein product [Cladocopium goreaui]
MMFNPVGSLVGAGIKTFLLESSRVVSQQKGEKNYHVFYELLAGMEEEALNIMWLERDRSYKLLHASGASPQPADANRLAKQFQELRQALSIFLDEETQDHIWQTLAALIHLGEVDFQELEASDESEKTGEPYLEPSPSHCSATPSSAANTAASEAISGEALSTQSAKVEIDEKTEDCLDMACDLLGLNVVSVAKVLKFREMHVNRQGRISHIKCPRTLAQARQTLQCIIKILYKRLFDKIVSSINEVSNSGAARQSEGNYHNIGTLDIYGFERLESNSFEQLCINLANERLQQFFVEEVLEAEQRMYRDERLNVHSMELPDSAPVVSGIQSVLRLLDEHSLRAVKNLVREGAQKDSKFCEQVGRTTVSLEAVVLGEIIDG